ncbi:MAG: ArsR family transcriptional regulator [Bacteroidetes bacterium]|nr:MAG: ArsR family transcriptional regulator [Bacteroidota bacterium]
MLEPIVGSKSSEQVFIFLIARNEGYATEIAKFFGADLYAIQKQLERLENSEVLVSKKIGRTRVYQFNPRYPFLKEFKGLLERVLSFYPDDIQENLVMNRRRPRKKDKPL